MATELKESMKMISHQIKNTYKEIKIVFKKSSKGAPG